jgi:hypothetical protein
LSRRTAPAFLPWIALVVGLALGGCGGAGQASPTASAPSSPVEGVVIDVDTAGLGNVTGFTIRTGEGRQIVFALRGLENSAEFPPAHLSEHLASSQPVRVWFRPEGGELVAYRLEDAVT